jgi:hypothetical protein
MVGALEEVKCASIVPQPGGAQGRYVRCFSVILYRQCPCRRFRWPREGSTHSRQSPLVMQHGQRSIPADAEAAHDLLIGRGPIAGGIQSCLERRREAYGQNYIHKTRRRQADRPSLAICTKIPGKNTQVGPLSPLAICVGRPRDTWSGSFTARSPQAGASPVRRSESGSFRPASLCAIVYIRAFREASSWSAAETRGPVRRGPPS